MMKIGINIDFFFKNTKLQNIYNSGVHYLFKNHNCQYTFTWENFNNGIFYNTYILLTNSYFFFNN